MNNASDNVLVTYATDYIRQGFVVMPVVNTYNKQTGKTEKKPTMKEWQKLRLPKDEERILRAFTYDNRVNAIGLLTGEVNGIFVLDVDPGADISGKYMPPTVTARTGRGKHFYFQYQSGLGNTVDSDNNLDTRGDGGFVVVPPSWHGDGQYEWLVDLDADLLAEIPEWLLVELKRSKGPVSRYAFGTGEGGRNQSAASVVGHVLSGLHEDFWEDFAWHGLRKWNQRNTPPLPDDELYKVFISIASREKRKREAYGHS